jgi:hypothetical protein
MNRVVRRRIKMKVFLNNGVSQGKAKAIADV